MDTSIIIVNYNTPEVTIECLNSLKKFKDSFNFSFEVILVDNAPRKQYKSLFENCFPDIIYIKSEKNIGFGPANNMGMELARGKYFLLLNSDTIITDNSINLSIDYLEADIAEQTGLIGCKLLNEDLSYQHSFYPFTGNSIWNYFKANNPILNKLFQVNRKFQELHQNTRVGDVSGAFMLLRAKVFLTLKGFDPDFFLYCEETEWCRNRIAKHFDIVYFPATSIIHLGGKSAPKDKMAIQSSIAEYLFWYKCGIAYYVLFFLINTINLLTQIIIFPFVSKGNRIDLNSYLKRYFIALKYAITDIPKYAPAYASRKKPLYYKGAEQIFFGPNI